MGEYAEGDLWSARPHKVVLYVAAWFSAIQFLWVGHRKFSVYLYGRKGNVKESFAPTPPLCIPEGDFFHSAAGPSSTVAKVPAPNLSLTTFVVFMSDHIPSGIPIAAGRFSKQLTERVDTNTYATVPYPTVPYPIVPYPTLPYPTLPYPTLLYPSLRYPTLRYPTLR